MKNAPNLELSLLARQWGASAVPFGELSAEAWLETPQSERALAWLDQTATLRSVMLLAGPNGVGKSALVGRWLNRLDRRLFCPLLLTHASLSGCGLLSALASKLGKRATFRREANLALIEAALAELGKVVPLILLATKSPVVHRNQCPGTEFEKCPDRFLRIHVNFAAGWRLVRTDRKQRNLNPVAIANLSKAGKVGAVAAVENGAAVCCDDKSTEVAM